MLTKKSSHFGHITYPKQADNSSSVFHFSKKYGLFLNQFYIFTTNAENINTFGQC